jgi:hypothetical protein
VNVAELVAVHFHMDGADRRARRHNTEIAQQLLDRIVRKQRDPIVRSDAAALKPGGKTANKVAQARIIHCAPIIGGNDPGLLRQTRGRAGDPVLQKL